LQYYSCVFENGHGVREGDAEAEEFEAEETRVYEHTHVALWFTARIKFSSARYFDVHDGAGAVVHPHIKSVKSERHIGCIYWKYHRKEPVKLYQSVQSPRQDFSSGDVYNTIRDCATLVEACISQGIVPRSVQDIVAIRAERDPPPPAERKYSPASFLMSVQEGYRVLYLWGPSNTGKTEWAVHQFKNCLLVRSLDQLHWLSKCTGDKPLYDGFVLDDVNVDRFEPEDLIQLCEFERDSCIRLRYRDGVIPAGLRRIICSNKSPEEFFRFDRCNADQRLAIRRRIRIVHVLGATFKKIPEDLEENLSLGSGCPAGQYAHPYEGAEAVVVQGEEESLTSQTELETGAVSALAELSDAELLAIAENLDEQEEVASPCHVHSNKRKRVGKLKPRKASRYFEDEAEVSGSDGSEDEDEDDGSIGSLAEWLTD